MSTDHKIAAAARKPSLGLIPIKALYGMARVFGYGASKYAPGNFLLATLDDGAGERYVSAALRHLADLQGLDGLYSAESLAAIDAESGLPHLDHALCGLLMLRAILIKEHALCADPGAGNGRQDILRARESLATVLRDVVDAWDGDEPELSVEDVAAMERGWSVPLTDTL
jgi:hypothetical protein